MRSGDTVLATAFWITLYLTLVAVYLLVSSFNFYFRLHAAKLLACA